MARRRDFSEWWERGYYQRLVAGVAAVLFGLAWRIRGPIGHVEVQNYRIPDLRAADLAIIPIMVGGLLLMSSRPRVRYRDRVIGTALLLFAGAWLVTKHPFAGPVIWHGPHQHGIHLGDLLAAVPALLGLQILVRSRVPPRRASALVERESAARRLPRTSAQMK